MARIKVNFINVRYANVELLKSISKVSDSKNRLYDMKNTVDYRILSSDNIHRRIVEAGNRLCDIENSIDKLYEFVNRSVFSYSKTEDELSKLWYKGKREI